MSTPSLGGPPPVSSGYVQQQLSVAQEAKTTGAHLYKILDSGELVKKGFFGQIRAEFMMKSDTKYGEKKNNMLDDHVYKLAKSTSELDSSKLDEVLKGSFHHITERLVKEELEAFTAKNGVSLNDESFDSVAVARKAIAEGQKKFDEVSGKKKDLDPSLMDAADTTLYEKLNEQSKNLNSLEANVNILVHHQEIKNESMKVLDRLAADVIDFPLMAKEVADLKAQASEMKAGAFKEAADGLKAKCEAEITKAKSAEIAKAKEDSLAEGNNTKPGSQQVKKGRFADASERLSKFTTGFSSSVSGLFGGSKPKASPGPAVTQSPDPSAGVSESVVSTGGRDRGDINKGDDGTQVSGGRDRSDSIGEEVSSRPPSPLSGQEGLAATSQLSDVTPVSQTVISLKEKMDKTISLLEDMKKNGVVDLPDDDMSIADRISMLRPQMESLEQFDGEDNYLMQTEKQVDELNAKMLSFVNNDKEFKQNVTLPKVYDNCIDLLVNDTMVKTVSKNNSEIKSKDDLKNQIKGGDFASYQSARNFVENEVDVAGINKGINTLHSSLKPAELKKPFENGGQVLGLLDQRLDRFGEKNKKGKERTFSEAIIGSAFGVPTAVNALLKAQGVGVTLEQFDKAADQGLKEANKLRTKWREELNPKKDV